MDNSDRGRKEAEPLPPTPSAQKNGYCDPQLVPAPGIVYQPCRPCEQTLPLKQIKEDRAYLEFLSQSVFGSSPKGDKLDLPAVSQWAGEIRKRVRRLKASLALPETEGSSPPMSDSQIPSNRIDLANAVMALSRLTSETLRNPILSGRLLDQALSAKAVHDLTQMESLAGLIQSGCQIVSKTSR